MWQTPLGKRTLSGAEGDLFRLGAGIYQMILIDMAAAGEEVAPDPEGDRWDQLPWQQQVCAIGALADHALGLSGIEPPEPCAWTDLTVWKIYEFLIDSDDLETFGKPVALAAVEVGLLKRKKKLNVDEFHSLAAQLRDRIIFDREFDSADVDRVRSEGLKAVGLTPEYFSTLFPAFNIHRYLCSVHMLNEDKMEMAESLLPRYCRVSPEMSEIEFESEWHPLLDPPVEP